MCSDHMYNGSEGITVEIGRVCYIKLQTLDFSDTNKLRVRVAFLPINPAATSLQFTADLSFDGQAQNLGISSPTVPAAATLSQIGTEGATVTEAVIEASNISVKETVKAVFNISIPALTTIPMKILLMSSPNEGRASVTLSNLRVTYTGR
ncbi:uncharacterized protein LOC121860293 [Homarus americanus]|uniref:uncharacterized protein LOC121860293 n=1 Tax=Homarus americanus TaxID=6706 RepID=UPI001C4966E7|nr:uncharacterized protein LOC121860293 [Homarus americanus]